VKTCVRLLVFFIGIAAPLLSGTGAAGDHSLNNDIRRWPFWWHEQRCISQGWGGTFSHNQTTYYALDFLPANCPYNPPAWVIRAAADGVVQCWWVDGFGYLARLGAPDGLTDVYAHKPGCDLAIGAFAKQGAYLGWTGSTGYSTAIHLHYDVWRSEGVSTGYALSRDGPFWDSCAGIPPPCTPVANAGKTSNNSGVAYACCSDPGSDYAGISVGYQSVGGYNPVGSSAAVGSVWSPCRVATSPNLPWVYGCYNGWVQTFKGPGAYDNAQHALMWRSGSSQAYFLPRGTLGGYTDIYNGEDWVKTIGYPMGNRVWNNYCAGGACYQQWFERGRVDYFPSSCTAKFYGVSSLLYTYWTYCD